MSMDSYISLDTKRTGFGSLCDNRIRDFYLFIYSRLKHITRVWVLLLLHPLPKATFNLNIIRCLIDKKNLSSGLARDDFKPGVYSGREDKCASIRNRENFEEPGKRIAKIDDINAKQAADLNSH